MVNGMVDMDEQPFSICKFWKELTIPSTDANRATMKYRILGEIACENIPVSAHSCDNERMFRHAKLPIICDTTWFLQRYQTK